MCKTGQPEVSSREEAEVSHRLVDVRAVVVILLYIYAYILIYEYAYIYAYILHRLVAVRAVVVIVLETCGKNRLLTRIRVLVYTHMY
jgi:hypothetical protein